MKISLLFLCACVLILSGQIASGQEGQRDPGPMTELLTMNGSKPSLSVRQASRDGMWPSEADIRKRFADVNTRTLHAITPEDEPLVMVVALKDFSKSRERLTADLAISGTGPSQVTEGRSVTYELQITNKDQTCEWHETACYNFAHGTARTYRQN